VASLQLQDAGSIPGLAQWLKVSSIAAAGVGHNCGLDLIPGPETVCLRAAKKLK